MSLLTILLFAMLAGSLNDSAHAQPASTTSATTTSSSSSSTTTTSSENKKVNDLDFKPEYIGNGEMLKDGTILLHLMRHQGGNTYHDDFRYETSDPDYKMILDHIGPVQPNSTFPVRPFNR